ncbi:VanZ family protein [Lentzea alba]|uniref:VanZ family protein n=1 Tax=Lentzea alba TaxID=2714351 RepID=UPI0039BEE0EB
MPNTWYGWVGTFTGVVAITVLSTPVAALTVCGLALARRRAGAEKPWQRSLAEVAMVYGTVPWVWMILLPGDRPFAELGPLNLVPLRDLLEMDAGQVVGNLAAFAVFGFFAPLRFPELASVRRVVTLVAGFTALLETAQYLWLDRVSSVDDVLLNTTGAGLAALLSSPLWQRAGDRRSDMRAISRSA